MVRPGRPASRLSGEDRWTHRREPAEEREAEFNELMGLHRAKGFSPAAVRPVATELTERDALAAHVDIKLGIAPDGHLRLRQSRRWSLSVQSVARGSRAKQSLTALPPATKAFLVCTALTYFDSFARPYIGRTLEFHALLPDGFIGVGTLGDPPKLVVDCNGDPGTGGRPTPATQSAFRKVGNPT